MSGWSWQEAGGGCQQKRENPGSQPCFHTTRPGGPPSTAFKRRKLVLTPPPIWHHHKPRKPQFKIFDRLCNFSLVFHSRDENFPKNGHPPCSRISLILQRSCNCRWLLVFWVTFVAPRNFGVGMRRSSYIIAEGQTHPRWRDCTRLGFENTDFVMVHKTLF